MSAPLCPLCQERTVPDGHRLCTTCGDHLPERDARYAVYRDGSQRSPSGLTHNEAFVWLLRHQGQSVDHATTHEGWSIEPQTYCAAHDIFECPFAHDTRRIT